MKVRTKLSLLVIAATLFAPAAYGADAAPDAQSADAVAAQGDTSPQGQQDLEEDEPFDDGLPPATQTDVNAVRDEVQVLRDQWQKGIDRTVVSTKRLLSISGSGQFRYDHVFDDTTSTSFKVNNLILGFKGSLKKDYEEGKNLDYSLGLSTSNTKKQVSITDALLSYQIFNSIDKEAPRLSITLGQQKKFFGLEATASEEFKPTISGAQFASKLSLDERDIGIVLAGDLFPSIDYGFNYRVPLVQYYLGAINGTGPNAEDNNNEKDLFARIVFNAPVNYSHPLRGLTLGGSGYFGRKIYTATIKNSYTVTSAATPAVTPAPIISGADTTISASGNKTRWGVDLSYVNTPVGFTFEYVQGHDLIPRDGKSKDKKPSTAGFDEATAEGITFTLFYNFGEQFVNSIKTQERWDDWYPLTYQPFYRFDRYTADINKKGTHTDIHTVGFNWFFAATTKLQINYNLKKDSPTDKKDNQLQAQFQFGF